MRIFVGIDVSDPDAVGSIRRFQSESGIGARPVDPRNLHFTLQFLGEVPEEGVQEIIGALRGMRFHPFTVGLRGVGAYPSGAAPRIVWIGVGRNRDLLADVAEKARASLAHLGIVPDKPFSPHVTVFRVKRAERISADLAGLRHTDFGDQPITCVKLKRSTLTPGGPVYSDLLEVAAS